MSGIVKADILRKLDRERRAIGRPPPNRSVLREHSPDGSECRIVYSHCTAEKIQDVIGDEMSLAASGAYSLEWKVYGHDVPPNLGDYLLATGFQPDPLESVMVLPVTEEALAVFDAPAYAVRRIHDAQGLNDVADIGREIGRTNAEEEKHRLAWSLRETPDELSVHVAYVDGEPVACGRIHFRENSDFAELAGCRTKTTHRNRGLFTALTAACLREALARNRTHVFVDALPTSEPILRKMGFQFITHTQPFVYKPPSLQPPRNGSPPGTPDQPLP